MIVMVTAAESTPVGTTPHTAEQMKARHRRWAPYCAINYRGEIVIEL